MKKHSGTIEIAFELYQIMREGLVTPTSRLRVRDLISGRAVKVLKAPESETWRENLLDALECKLDKFLWRLTEDGNRLPTRDRPFRAFIHDLLLRAYYKNAPPTTQLHDLEQTLECTIPFPCVIAVLCPRWRQEDVATMRADIDMGRNLGR